MLSSRSISGILPVNKPKYISSFDVIRRIKQNLSAELKKVKIGHGGTLDNLACGVLPVLFGEATKAFDFLLNSDKVYQAVIRLGAFTETDDAEGKILESFPRKITVSEIQQILPKFTGKLLQVPPKYSAIRINGKRSYELARENINAELKPREVTVSEIKLDDFHAESRKLTLTIICSSGTYIRSIARDIGEELKCGGYIEDLIRLKSGGIALEECMKLDDFPPGEINPEALQKMLIDVNHAIRLPILEIKRDKEYILNGKFLKNEIFISAPQHDGIYKIVQDGRLLAVIEKNREVYRYLRVFNE